MINHDQPRPWATHAMEPYEQRLCGKPLQSSTETQRIHNSRGHMQGVVCSACLGC
jgi:hypothetical protein